MKVYGLYVCDDCASWLSNADATGLDFHYSPDEAEQRLADIQAGEREITRTLGSICAGDEENTESLSTGWCDCCGNRRAGRRTHFLAMATEYWVLDVEYIGVAAQAMLEPRWFEIRNKQPVNSDGDGIDNGLCASHQDWLVYAHGVFRDEDTAEGWILSHCGDHCRKATSEELSELRRGKLDAGIARLVFPTRA